MVKRLGPDMLSAPFLHMNVQKVHMFSWRSPVLRQQSTAPVRQNYFWPFTKHVSMLQSTALATRNKLGNVCNLQNLTAFAELARGRASLIHRKCEHMCKDGSIATKQTESGTCLLVVKVDLTRAAAL